MYGPPLPIDFDSDQRKQSNMTDTGSVASAPATVQEQETEPTGTQEPADDDTHKEVTHEDAPNINEQPVKNVRDCCDCRGPCVYPQGKKAARAVFLAIIACIFSIAGVGGCNFLTVDGDPWGLLWRQEHFIEGNLTDRKLHCTAWSAYEKDIMDAKYKTGRAFAFFTIITLILGVSPVLALSCATIDKTSLGLLAACFVLATLFQGLVFISFASDICQYDFHCKISFGGGLTVAGMLFCLLTAFCLVRVKPMSAMPPTEKVATAENVAAKDEEFKSINRDNDNVEESSTHAAGDEEPHDSNAGLGLPIQEIGVGLDEEAGKDAPADVVTGENVQDKKQGWWKWW
ncbi:hypothetical protein MPSEU_001046700 [Mayamaea pseudoterrestris]|nr:hypothetical protein MPSEU_001046700 [Mayamaea pseudoterrestris]